MSKLCIRTCLNNLYLSLRSSKEDCPRLVIASLLSEHESLDTITNTAENIIKRRDYEKDSDKDKVLDASKPITLDFLTNPDKE